jgi:preprotein translocase subunit YajC
MLHLALLTLLQAADATQTTPPTGGEASGSPLDSVMGFMPVILIFGIMYFVLIGPERKQRKKRETMLKALKKGDKVVTSGGMHGTIATITDTLVTLQVDEGVRLKFSRAAISDVVSDEAPVKNGADKDASAKEAAAK